jgi:hypothetical protein
MTARSLLVFSRDPGPTNLLVAALEILRKDASSQEPAGLRLLRTATDAAINNLIVASRPPGEEIWSDSGFSPVTWHGKDEPAATRLLEENFAGVLMTGTSDLDEPGDRALWLAARARQIESHALLDHPACLIERFQDSSGKLIWPDWLYVSDDIFRQRLVDAGTPAGRIRLIGEIHHSRILRLAASRPEQEIALIRTKWGARSGLSALLFVSECTSEMALLGYKTNYKEADVLDAMLEQLARGNMPDGRPSDSSKLIVIIRPHPRDTPGKYSEVISKWQKKVQIIVSSEGSPDLAVLAADLTVGMNSSLLYEAVALGRPTVSLTGHKIFATKSTAI